MNQVIGIKIAGEMVCPHCGSKHTECIGGSHYVKTGEGYGHDIRKTGYKCNSCNELFIG